ncbi:Canalicular multispecific organic anion transporter 2 [Orobanche minor]
MELGLIFFGEPSGFIHLILLFGLMFSGVFKWILRTCNEHPNDKIFGYYKHVLFSSLSLSFYNLVLLCWNCFSWYSNGWSDELLATLLGLGLRMLAWMLVCIYLHAQYLHRSNGVKLPLPLRTWWVFYLGVSCYCLVIDTAQCRGNHNFPVQRLVSDAVYVLSGAFLCFVGIFGQVTSEDSNLQEPFLNGNDGVFRVDETISSPYMNAGFLSSLTFTWVGPLISKGYNKTLDLEDVPSLSGKANASESYMNFRNFMDYFAREDSDIKKVTSMQLVKSLIFTTWADILLTTILCFTFTLAVYVGPYLIDTFVQYLKGRREFKDEGYLLVFAFFIAKLVEFVCQRHWFMRLEIVGIRAKAVLIESIYSKALTLSFPSKQCYTSGDMINFMSVDAERVGNFIWYMHDPWMVILHIVLALMILYKSLGIASIAALVTFVVIMLANYPLTTLLEKYQKKLMESKDKRMKATTEILKNMGLLKLQVWEMKFLSRVVELRNCENVWLKKFLYTSVITTFVFWGFPTFVAVVTFWTCMMMGIPLETGKVLSALATFRILQGPIYSLPDTISMIIQTKVSLDRIASFLCLDDLDPNTVERIHRATTSDVAAVEIFAGYFSWDPSPASGGSTTLKDINLTVQHGMRVAVCGAVGSGKSTLLSCILGEVPKISGALRLISDNILFGREMDHERYDRVLEACSLKKDLDILSSGDQMIVGERGINLSGGQKQRIQIARALYQDADIYLFDDPFSAVDAHTSSHLFKECLLRLCKFKTVIYVTHQVEFLSAADLILVMKNGRILQAGKYNDILASGTDFVELVGAHEKALSAFNSIEPGVVKPTFEGESSDKKALEEESNDGKVGKADDMMENKKGQLVKEVEREKGRTGLLLYWNYITTAYGGALVPFILLAQILFQVLQILSDYWMAWATPVSPGAKSIIDRKNLIFIYIALAIGSAFCVLARETLLIAAYKTATSLFSKMHSCIFHAPMSFFDATPSGRILNRASTDQTAVDMSISYKVGAFAFSLIQLLGIVVVMSEVAWQVFVIFIPVIAISFWYQQYYIPSARELSRLVGVTKAPVIQHFAETISGASTIRSFDQESRFCETSMKLINGYSRPKFYNAAAMQWLSIRLDVLSSITFAASLIFLISIPAGLIDPVIAGLSVTYGLNLNMLQGWMIWNLCDMENKIISVERILQYSCITSEPPLVIEENRPDSSWPSHGEVNVQDLQIRYAPQLPLVLRGITCNFQGGKKTGIVGRTGSGKSTLIQAFFRIVEPAAGVITLDGINICSIVLHDLRSRLSIIPQDPTMFEGTVRSNLDPLEQYSDKQIWEALDKCQLGDEVRKKEQKLDSLVCENGENWSMGQRQLVCLGRVLLKRSSKVLILDEATASVDTATDNLIQQTLVEHFSDSTVIIIAHRITFVIDSDMVLLLSNGLVEECDSPSRLLDNKSSSFAKLVAEYTARSISNAEKKAT